MPNPQPAAPAATTRDKDRKGYVRNKRVEADTKYKHDLCVCLTSRTESITTGHLTPYFVLLPELTSISNNYLEMAQALSKCFKVPRSGVQVHDLPIHSGQDATDPVVNPVLLRLKQSKMYQCLLKALSDIDSGVRFLHGVFVYDPRNITYANRQTVTNFSKFNYLTLLT